MNLEQAKKKFSTKNNGLAWCSPSVPFSEYFVVNTAHPSNIKSEGVCCIYYEE